MAAACGIPAFMTEELENPFIYDAVVWYINRKDERRHDELRLQAKQLLLLDALATMLGGFAGHKLPKGMLDHLERKNEPRKVMAVDVSKLPDPATLFG